MFTGIVSAVGTVASAEPSAGGMRLRIDAGGLALDDAIIGESIAVNGVCLTVVALTKQGFDADVSQETMRCTTGFVAGARVNMERALRLADRLGGHLMTGHVDGVGTVAAVQSAGDNRVLLIAAPADSARYIARKGSISVNGVSLTVNEVNGMEFTLNIIPHTLSATNLGSLKSGDRVNLEVDTIARYVERMREFGAGQ